MALATMYLVFLYLGKVRLKIRLSFLILNLVFITGLFFPGFSIGVYFCTLAPLLVLLKQNHGVMKSSKLIIFVGIFVINVFFQTLIGYPPNIKLFLNFTGNLLMIYSIISLLSSEIIFTEYLKQFLKLQFLLGSILVGVALVLYGTDFYFVNKNQIYSNLNIYPPALWVTKQVTAPFLIFSSIMAWHIIKPNHFFRNSIIIFFMINGLILAFGSRSAVLAVIVTVAIFGGKKYLSKLPITITIISLFGVALVVLNSAFEDYLDIIRLVDVRGIIYSQILSEVVTNPFGVGYGNTIEYLTSNNSELYSNTYSSFRDLNESNESFVNMDFDQFPVNVESSLFILLLEQGAVVTVLFYAFFVKNIAKMCSSKDRLIVLFTIALSVVFFTSLTEDNFLLIPYMFYVSLLLRLVFFQKNKVLYH